MPTTMAQVIGGALIAKGDTGKYIDVVCSITDPVSLCDDLRPLKEDEPVTLYTLQAGNTITSTVRDVLEAIEDRSDLLVKRYRARLRPAEAAASFTTEIDTYRALYALLGSRHFMTHTSLRTITVQRTPAVAALVVRGRYYIITAKCSVTMNTLLHVGQMGGEEGLCSVVDDVLATLVRLQKGRRYHLDIKTENILRCPGSQYTLIDWDRSMDIDQLRERYRASNVGGGTDTGARPYGALMYASPVCEALWTRSSIGWTRRTASILKESARTSLSLMGARRLMAFIEEHVRPTFERAGESILNLDAYAPRMDLYSLGICMFVACHTDSAGIPWSTYNEFVRRLTACDDTGFANAAEAQKGWRRLMKARK